MSQLDIDSVRQFCHQREVDLVLAPPPHPYVLRLRGQFDAAGDFFSILAQDVEFVRVAGGITVGDLRMGDFAELCRIVPRWKSLSEIYSGPALAVRNADTETWTNTEDHTTFLLVANRIELVPGPDWPAAYKSR